MGIRTALVVDDSRSARYILQRLLEQRHIQVDLVGSAQQALTYLSEHRPDVVFMDEMMPGMEGHEAVDQLAADPNTQAIPIIMYTARDYAEAEAPVLQRGVIGVLSKPFTPEDVNALLEKLEVHGGVIQDVHAQPDVARLIRAGKSILDVEPETVVSHSVAQAPTVEESNHNALNIEKLRGELTSTVKSEVRMAVDQWLGETLENQIAEQIDAQYVAWRGALREVRADQARFQGQVLEQRIPRLLDLLENRLDQRITLAQKNLAEQISDGAPGPQQRKYIANMVRNEIGQAAQRPARQAARQVAAELMRSDMSLLNLRLERVRRRMNTAIGFGVMVLLGCIALAYFAGTLH